MPLDFVLVVSWWRTAMGGAADSEGGGMHSHRHRRFGATAGTGSTVRNIAQGAGGRPQMDYVMISRCVRDAVIAASSVTSRWPSAAAAVASPHCLASFRFYVHNNAG